MEDRMKSTRKKRPIIYNSLMLEVMGSRAVEKKRTTDGCVTDYLTSLKRIAKCHLKECAKISPELKGFRLRFS
jgi:hypothetical protein